MFFFLISEFTGHHM